MAVLQSLINRLGKGRGKKRKKNYYNTGYSYLVTQPSTNPAQQGLTLLSGCSMLLSLWCSNSTLSAFLKFLRWEKVSKREKTLILHGWESREQKHTRSMKMRTITCFGDRTSGTFLIIDSVSRTKITRSHGPITLWMWMFSAVLHLLVYSLTVAFCTVS